MELALDNRRAVITGASKGIGLGVARALAAEGVHVLLASRNDDALRRECATIASEFNVEAEAVAVDLATAIGQRTLADAAIDWDPDVLVNNAGAIPGGSIIDVDESTWRNAWDLKVFGYVNLTRFLLPHFETRGKGVILNVIGAAADRPSPGYIAGAVGNSGLVAFTKALGSTSLRNGVRVLAVNPGLIITDRMSDLLRKQAAERFGDQDRWEELIPTDPAPGTVEQVADVVTFLVSDRASHVSGVVLTIDGGATARS